MTVTRVRGCGPPQSTDAAARVPGRATRSPSAAPQRSSGEGRGAVSENRAAEAPRLPLAASGCSRRLSEAALSGAADPGPSQPCRRTSVCSERAAARSRPRLRHPLRRRGRGNSSECGGVWGSRSANPREEGCGLSVRLGAAGSGGSAAAASPSRWSLLPGSPAGLFLLSQGGPRAPGRRAAVLGAGRRAARAPAREKILR